MKLYYSFCLCLLACLLNAQSILPKDLVNQAKEKNSLYKSSLFTLSNNASRSGLPSTIKEFSILELNKSNVASLLEAKESFIQLTIPSSDRKKIELELVEVQNRNETVFQTSDSKKPFKYNRGRHFRGIVKGDNASVAAISVFNDEVMGMISQPSELGNLVLGKLTQESNDAYILYRDNELLSSLEHQCGVKDSGEGYSREDLKHDASRAPGDCVRLFIEVNNDIATNKGGTTNTINYITAVYNQMATLYAAEQINTVLSEVFVWTTPSPYNATTADGLLNQFAAQKNGFNGDLAMLVGFAGSGGIAYVNTLCSNNPDVKIGYSGIGSTYNNVPTYSWSVNVLAHEFGHLFGSQHTHACVWNGNNTAIDGCSTPEGTCGNPGLPTGGGTIMSYCHTKSVGINFSLGFGAQPGSVMRGRVAAASCLSQCTTGGGTPTCSDGIKNGNETGIDCGGASCPPCQATNCVSGTLTIVLDEYPTETAWSIKNAANIIVASGNNYNQINGTVSVPVCLPGACYTLTFTDAYGDGICCGFGNGSFKLVVNGQTLANGGQFGAATTLSFCVNAGATPTCTDGIKNGNETGIDCGGSCAACAVTPTCTDGIKNGNEIGIDCGGSCIACPTCNDGIKNGNETGIDCGGSCTACPTCSDGIKNGNETGIDCGGSCIACVAAPTCSDGIKNGNETGIDCGGSCATCVAAPTCSDGIKNGNEIGIDCGGSCAACVATPTCSDGIKNGNETGIDCGGSCSACTTSACQQGVVNLVLDFYPTETAWNIKNASNTTLYSGSGYSQVSGSYNIPICLPVGCYTFNITDAYGDGICCSYGNGSFKVVVNSQTLVTGGQFSNAKTVNFCVVGSTATPTCNDGIKNGNETGIDCGGSCTACVATPTCNDGIKNGNEIGIDCGGSCTACVATPTCSDGIKNGNETGIDCGGSCTACVATPTCSDGIKNGNETGIDCGGTCTACVATPTCSDGVKNGNETGIDCGGSCPACPTTACTQGAVNLVLDFYPTETAWNIKNSNNAILFSGSGYTQINGIYNIPICLSNGCYTFNITDAYGDGICCNYGNGSFKVVVNGQTLVTGGQFTNAKTINFCVGGGGSSPSCTDGVKNGNETGIDCGGSCPACPSGTNLLAGFYFENSMDDWTVGGVDAYRCTNCQASEGIGAMVIRDNSGVESSMISPTFPGIQNYPAMKIEFTFFGQSVEVNEGFFLEYSNNNGTTWNSITSLRSGIEFSNGSFISVAVNIATTFAANTRIRFRADASDDTDLIYLDAIKVSGVTGNVTNNIEVNYLAANQKLNALKIYPNPTSKYLIIELEAEILGKIKTEIYDLTGRKVKEVSFDGSNIVNQIEVDDLINGIYLLRTEMNGVFNHQKVIIEK